MEQVIAGRYETKVIADTVASVLREFVDDADTCIYSSDADRADFDPLASPRLVDLPAVSTPRA